MTTHHVARRLSAARAGLGALALASLLLGAPAAWAQQWSAATMPLDGNIAGTAGARIGWGYQIDNQEATNWLVLTGLSADAVQHAVADSLFDLPIIAPGASAMTAYAGATGLYALTWDADAPVGFVNFGSFVLSAEWWDGDPLAGGQFLALADDISLNYSALVTQVPELPPAAMLLLGLAALQLRRRFSRA